MSSASFFFYKSLNCNIHSFIPHSLESSVTLNKSCTESSPACRNLSQSTRIHFPPSVVHQNSPTLRRQRTWGNVTKAYLWLFVMASSSVVMNIRWPCDSVWERARSPPARFRWPSLTVSLRRALNLYFHSWTFSWSVTNLLTFSLALSRWWCFLSRCVNLSVALTLFPILYPHPFLRDIPQTHGPQQHRFIVTQSSIESNNIKARVVKENYNILHSYELIVKRHLSLLCHCIERVRDKFLTWGFF